MSWLSLYNLIIDWCGKWIIINRCTCGSDYSVFDRGDRYLKWEELNATFSIIKDQAQASSLMRIPAEYKEYEYLFREKPMNEIFLKY